MSEQRVSRRDFLRVGAAVTAAATSSMASGAGEAEQPVRAMPRRRLGRTGIEVTILNQGEGKLNERHLNIMHDEGIRFMDTSGWYQGGRHERAVGEWLNRTGRRGEYCVVTKDRPRSSDQWVAMLDRRLENGRQEYFDGYFLHGLGPDGYPSGVLNWPKSPEWARAADRIRKSGKARFVGFSCCCDPVQTRIAMLHAAAEGGWADAIMVAADPILIREDAAFNKALDACHRAGIGLIAMKELRGRRDIGAVVPKFEARGLTAIGAVLTAMWSDERFAAITSHMDNIVKLKENAATARAYRPMSERETAAVHGMLRGHTGRFCIGCDGSCRRAAGTETAFDRIARYLCYYEEDGDRSTARRLYAALPEAARDWTKADLAAASRACVSRLDFEALLRRAAEKLA